MVTSHTDFKTTKVDTAGELGADKYNGNQSNIAADRTRLSNTAAPVAGSTQLAPAAQIDQTQANQARNDQNGLVHTLQQTAAGNGPSATGNLLRAATEQTLAGNAALAASQHGGTNPALAARGLQQSAVIANQSLGQQLANQKANEMLAASNQLGGVISNERGQDLGAATTNAGFQQGTNLQQGSMNQGVVLANQNAGLVNNGQNINAATALDNSGLNSINSQTGAVKGVSDQAINQDEWVKAQQAKQDAANAAGLNSMIGAGIGAAGSIATGGL